MDKQMIDRIAHEVIAESDRAYKLLSNADNLVKLLRESIKKVETEATHLQGELKGLDKLGSGKMEAENLLSKLLPSLENLERQVASHVRIIKQAL